MVFIYTSYPDGEEAEKIAKSILEKRMATDVDLWPINSVYISSKDNELKTRQESALLIKTTESKVQDIENLILTDNPQRTPCVATLDIRRVNREYKEWMAQCIQ